MFNFDDTEIEIMEQSQEALYNMRLAHEDKPKSLYDEIKENKSKVDYGQYLYDEYDLLAFEGKVKVDMMYYDHIFQSLQGTDAFPQVESLITNLYKNINQIYEFINIKPMIYGNNIDDSLLTESIESIDTKLSNVVYEFLDLQFYKLSPEQRREKYYDNSLDYIKETIESHDTDINTAIEHGVKSLVIEDLLTNIAFPFSIKCRINSLLVNEDYGKVFEQDELSKLNESIYTQIRQLSKIAAACI